MPRELEQRPDPRFDRADATTVSRVASGVRRALARLREFHADQVELHERLLLLNRPWEEALLHWCGDGPEAELHGHVAPPADGHRHSVTSRGWCPCHRSDRYA